MRTLKINRQDFALTFGFLLLVIILASTALYPQTANVDMESLILEAVYFGQTGGGSSSF